MNKFFKWILLLTIIIVLFKYEKIVDTIEDFIISEIYGEKEQSVELFFDDKYVESIKNKLNLDEHTDKETVSKAINKEMTENTKTLLKNFTLSTELNYFLRDNKIFFTTEAKYYNTELKCIGEYLDFDIATVANFGLRGYLIKTKEDGNCSIIEKGSYNTAYYSVAYDDKNDYLAYSIPGQKKIEIYNKNNMELIKVFEGYSATSLEFFNGDLYFAGYNENEEWNKSSIFQYSILKDKIIKEYFSKELADCRGISFKDNLMAVSNGIHNKVYIYMI